MKSSVKSIKACAAYYGTDADSVEEYLLDGEKRALELGNRGPINFNSDGSLSQDIRDAYSKFGFYIFENVIDNAELNDIEKDLDSLRSNFPTGPESSVDSSGNPAMNSTSKALTIVWSKPLGDPLGGTELANASIYIIVFCRVLRVQNLIIRHTQKE